ncbi:PEP-CTERM sorting domain-containing protein [Phenylobacterium sp.]|uniref:PEP-CTERM sorting domain-containing protein n=1 Tax=Phenylobacterium sp. TaxID=1871053 RepID=UPI002D1DA8B2|nr:PEP-CTERM sorting domain-containing protein [Phenylobacterium sp.]HLZ77340.1 PEP-CTERM sorting domain-containing protein [Phenylobacterium sp.]
MRMRGIKALAAAASLGVMAMAGQASATQTFTLVSSSMDQSYTALVTAPANGSYGAINEYVYDGPLTFTVSGYPGGATSLFGFCIDLYHDMNLGNLGWTYTTNQPDGGGLIPNAPQTLSADQTKTITDLVDTGWIMEMQGTAPDLAAQEAAIQAAIWNVEVPGSVSNFNSGLVASYYDTYANGPSSSWNLADANDRVFTISNGGNQSFAIGWPIAGVPEPTSWALMLTGFLGMGTMLRRQRKTVAATA